MTTVTLDGYLDVEDSLVARLSSTWRPLAAKLFVAIKNRVREGDFDGARDLAAEMDLHDVGSKNREFIRYSMFAAARFGAMVVAGDRPMRSSARRYDRLVNRVTETFCTGLDHNATIAVYKAVVQSIAQAEAEYANTQKADEPRFVKEFVSFADAGDKQLQMLAALNTNRLAVWGFTAEAEVRGVKTYRLQATLDNRTSAFCEMMDGREFQVEDASDKIREVLSVGSPDDLKSIQPWPAQDAESIAEYSGMSDEELMLEGLHIPPFHPNCRTLLIAVDDGDDNPKQNDFGEASDEHDFVATQDSFDELGSDVDQSDVDWWNANIGADPVALLEDLSGADGKQLLSGELGSQVRIRDDDVVLAANPLVGEGEGRLQQVFNPFTGRMYQTMAEFKEAGPQDAADFLRQLFLRSPEAAARLGSAELIMGAAGSGAFSLASIGFAPTQVDWQDLRDAISSDVASGAIPGFATLSKSEQQVVADLLASPDPQAAIVLADLTFLVNGRPIGEALFAGRSFQAILDFEDPFVMAQLGDVLEG